MNKNTNKRINKIISDWEKFIGSTSWDTIEMKWEKGLSEVAFTLRSQAGEGIPDRGNSLRILPVMLENHKEAGEAATG